MVPVSLGSGKNGSRIERILGSKPQRPELLKGPKSSNPIWGPLKASLVQHLQNFANISPGPSRMEDPSETSQGKELTQELQLGLGFYGSGLRLKV